MIVYRSGLEGLGNFEEESAYIELSDNPVEYSIEIDEYCYADVDEDDYLVGLELLSLKHVPSMEDIEMQVHIDLLEEIDLEAALHDLSSYSRIQRYFGA